MTGTGSSVLIVEDEALLLFVVADDLRDAGFQVFEAKNADEAIDQLQRHPDISVLFTDIDMPGSMDGIRLSEAVHNRWPPVRIIVTSGKGRPQSVMLPEGAVFIPKPYMPQAVAATIHRLLS